MSDRAFIAAHLENNDFAAPCQYDLDGNGVINVSDRRFVSANIGVCTELPDYMNGSGMNRGQPETRFGAADFFPETECVMLSCE